MADAAKPVARRSVAIKILLVFVVILLLMVGVIAIQPSEFQIIRSTTIPAAQSIVFNQVNDFHKWDAWSPWAKLDPAVKNYFEGATLGKGAIFKWSGNEKVGEGRMTILESRPSELIQIDLQFIRPYQDTCLAEFSFKPEGKETLVTWKMSGKKNFIGKAICLFMNMDKMVGGDFEKGLASMKEVSEAAQKQADSSSDPAADSSAEPAKDR